jgi:sugar phosphate isomerase/epimerase
MTRFAFSANAFRKLAFADALAEIRRAGYEGFELMADAPHAFPAHLTPEQTAALRDAIRASGLAVSNMNAFMMSAVRDFHHPSWIEPDPAFRRLRVEHTAAACRLARDLGVATLSTEPGGPLEEGMDRERAWAVFKEGLAEVLPVADACGVKVLVEPEPGLLIERADEMQRLLDEVPHPRLGLNFDMGHFYCVSEDPAALLRRFGPRVDHVHCEDIPADRRHYHSVPGEGAIDFHAVFEALRDIGYGGWVTVELYPFLDKPGEVAKRALEHLMKVRREVG